MRRYFTVKKVFFVLLTFVLLFVGVVYFANVAIERNAVGKTFDRICDTPHFRCALLLGTSKTGEHGDGNAFFAKRIKATAALFEAGKINCVIVSGDNGRKSYDEPTDMKLELIKKGWILQKYIWIVLVFALLTVWCAARKFLVKQLYW